MFEHSIKVPRHYKVAANIFKKVSTEGGSVKTLLYDDKLRHFRTNVLYALITETIKNAAEIQKVFECTGLLETESRLDPWLAKVLTAELLFGKKTLPGKSKPEQTILSYKDKFQTFINENNGDFKVKVRRPRYVRINTNLLTTSDAIRAFQEEGYKFIRCTSGSYDDYLQQIQGLSEYDFTQDYHVKTVFVFSSGTKWHDHELYLENKIILQDKATALAVHLLAPPQNSVVLDMCAAPGMKTTQLAAYLRNQGKVYAIERNETRYQTLCDFVEKTESKCVETVHKDALEIKRGDYDDVEYILLDPSCSGSGMEFCVHNYVEDTRLAKLTSLQEKFLKHAMNSFPNAKRIVYSTCSLFPEENERVITNVVKTSRSKWRVQDVKEMLKGQWNNFGSGMYGSMGTRCLYAKPDTDLTTGFFLAVLDRDQKDLEKSKMGKHEDSQYDESNNKSNLNNDESEIRQETKKKSNKRKYDENQINPERRLLSNEQVLEELSVKSEDKLKKSKKEKKVKDGENNIHNEDGVSDNRALENALYQEASQSKKKKKKKKDNNMLADDSSTDIGLGNVEEIICENNKKVKKKDKNKKCEENTLENVSELVNVDDEYKTKKKKKRKRESEQNNKTNEDGNEVVENVLGNYEELQPKKKKKKKKDKKKSLLGDENI